MANNYRDNVTIGARKEKSNAWGNFLGICIGSIKVDFNKMKTCAWIKKKDLYEGTKSLIVLLFLESFFFLPECVS